MPPVRPANDALAALAAPGTALAQADVPHSPGLYAIHASADVWRALGLGDAPDARPLYVGKAESSLADRDLRTHFGDGRTGSSTVRRTFAALLRDQLSLHAQPRNPAKPERFANYGLPPADDARLTAWMREHLRLAVYPYAGPELLAAIEIDLLAKLQPPLNLKDNATPWRDTVIAARAAMAAEAKAFANRPR